MTAVHGLRGVQQIHQRPRVERGNLGDRPVVAGARSRRGARLAFIRFPLRAAVICRSARWAAALGLTACANIGSRLAQCQPMRQRQGSQLAADCPGLAAAAALRPSAAVRAGRPRIDLCSYCEEEFVANRYRLPQLRACLCRAADGVRCVAMSAPARGAFDTAFAAISIRVSGRPACCSDSSTRANSRSVACSRSSSPRAVIARVASSCLRHWFRCRSRAPSSASADSIRPLSSRAPSRARWRCRFALDLCARVRVNAGPGDARAHVTGGAMCVARLRDIEPSCRGTSQLIDDVLTTGQHLRGTRARTEARRRRARRRLGNRAGRDAQASDQLKLRTGSRARDR